MDAFRAFTISDISRAMNNMTNSEVTGSRDFRSMTLNQRCCCRGSGGDWFASLTSKTILEVESSLFLAFLFDFSFLILLLVLPFAKAIDVDASSDPSISNGWMYNFVSALNISFFCRDSNAFSPISESTNRCSNSFFGVGLLVVSFRSSLSPRFPSSATESFVVTVVVVVLVRGVPNICSALGFWYISCVPSIVNSEIATGKCFNISSERYVLSAILVWFSLNSTSTNIAIEPQLQLLLVLLHDPVSLLLCFCMRIPEHVTSKIWAVVFG